MARKQIKVIDLFAGCGGFSVGFEKAGYRITKAVELDKKIAASYTYNHKGTFVYAEDIAKVADERHFKLNEADVIIGGPPCQGFSMAGGRIRVKTAFMDDPRNYLFRHYVEIVRIVRPKVFLLENVKGILSKDKGAIFKEIVDAFGAPDNFNGDKYYLHYKVCKAVEYGIPQRRERVVVIGVLNNDFDIDTIFAETKERIVRNNPAFFEPVTLYDAISDIPEPTEDGEAVLSECKSAYQASMRNGSNTIRNHTASHHNAMAIGRMKKISNGENWQSLHEDIHSVHSGAYGRMEWGQPAMTITTRFDTPAGGRFIHPVANRTLTPREAARVQSFPDSFTFIGNKTTVCKQIGNAVPPKLSYFLANAVKLILNEDGNIK